jgi:threonine synthase
LQNLCTKCQKPLFPRYDLHAVGKRLKKEDLATREVGGAEGLFVAPEGAACFVAARKLVASGKINAGERVVIFNTGSGIKYLDCYEED